MYSISSVGEEGTRTLTLSLTLAWRLVVQGFNDVKPKVREKYLNLPPSKQSSEAIANHSVALFILVLLQHSKT